MAKDYGGTLLPLSIDTGGIKAAAAQIGASFKSIGTAGRDAARTAAPAFASMSSNLTKFIGIAGGLYAVKAGFDAVTDAAIGFDKALHNVWTLTDRSATELQVLGGQVRSLARDFNITSTQATQALYQIKSATFYGAEAMEILEQSARGAAAGLSSVFTVADMMTTVLNAYGKSASEASHINDLLFQTVRYGKTTMNELANDFGRLAGVSAPIGAAVEEMTAAIATLTRQGIETDWAVTSLRQTLMQLLRPASELEAVIGALGYTSGSAMVQTLGFAKSIQTIATYAEVNNIGLENLFSNVRAVTAVLPLGTTAAAAYALDLNRMADAAGAADAAFVKQTESWDYQLQKIKTAINDIAISIGKTFVPALQGALNAIKMLLKPLGLLSEALAYIGGDIGLKIATSLGTITAAIVLMKKAISGLNTAVTTGRLANLGEFMRRLTGGVGVSAKHFWKGAGLLGAGFLGLGAGIKGLVNLDIEFQADAGKIAHDWKNMLMTVLGPILGGFALGGPVGAAIGAAISAVGVITVVVKHRIESANQEFRELWDIASGVVGRNLTSLPTSIADDPQRYLDDFSTSLAELDPVLRNAERGVEAMRAALMDLYAGDGTVRDPMLEMSELTRIDQLFRESLGIAFSEEAVETTVTAWAARTQESMLGALGTLPEALRRFINDDLKSAIDWAAAIVEEGPNWYRVIGDIEAALQSEMDAFDLANSTIENYAQDFADGIASFEAATTADEANAAYRSIQQAIDGIVGDLEGNELKAALIVALTSIPEHIRETLIEMSPVAAEDMAEWLALILDEATDQVDIVGKTTWESVYDARQSFNELWDSLTSGELNIEEAATAWETLTKTAEEWSAWSELATRLNLEGADAVKRLADEMHLLVGEIEDAADEVGWATQEINDFNDAIAAIDLSSISAGIQQAVSDLESAALAAQTLGDASTLLAGLVSGINSIEGQRSQLEQLMTGNAPDSIKQLAAQMYAGLEGYSDYLGMTFDEIAQENERLAQEAERQAEEAFRAAQEAFRDQFTTPIIHALRTGDFQSAAEEIKGFAENFNQLAGAGASLGIDAKEVLSLISSSKSELLSAVDGLMALNAAFPETVERLQYVKDWIEEHFAGPKSELEAALESKDLAAVLSAPIEVAQALQDLAQDDLSSVSSHTEELIQQLEEEIKWRELLGKDYSEYRSALLAFEAEIHGISPALAGLVDSLETHSDAIRQLANDLLPEGWAQIFANALDFIVTAGNVRWGGVPHFAEGGIVTSPTLALVGEAGPEMIVPLGGGFSMAGGGISTFSLPGIDGSATMPGDLNLDSPVAIDTPIAAIQADTFVFDSPAGASANAASFGAATSSESLISALSSAAQATEGFALTMGWAADAIQGTITSLNEYLFDVPVSPATTIGGVDQTEFEMAVPLGTSFGTPELESEFDRIASELEALESSLGGTAIAGAPDVFVDIPEINTDAIASAVGQAVTDAFAGMPFALTPEMPANEAVQEILRDAPTIADAMKLFRESWDSLLSGDFKGAWSLFSDGISAFTQSGGWEIAAAAVSTVSSVAGLVVDFVKAGIEKLQAAFDEVASAVVNFVKGAFNKLINAAGQLTDKFESLITTTDTYNRLQSALKKIQTTLFDALLGFLWPIIAIFEQLVGTSEDLNNSFNSLNVPTGYKVTRAAWKAATPGEPGVLRGGSDYPDWVSALLEKFGDAIKDALAPFKEFIDLIKEIWAELGPVILDGLLPALKRFGEGLLELGDKIKNELLPVMKEHLAGTIEGFLDFFFGLLIGAATGFVEILTNTLPNLHAFADVMGQIGRELPSLFEALGEGISPAINTVLDGLTSLGTWTVNTLMPDLEEFSRGFGSWWKNEVDPFLKDKVFTKIGEVGNDFYDMLKDVLSFLGTDVWNFVKGDLWDTFADILEQIVPLLRDLFETIRDHWPEIEEWITHKLDDWMEGLKVKYEQFKALSLQELGDFAGAVNVIWESEAMSFWQKLGTTAVLGVKQIWDNFKKSIEWIGDMISTFFYNLFHKENKEYPDNPYTNRGSSGSSSAASGSSNSDQVNGDTANAITGGGSSSGTAPDLEPVPANTGGSSSAPDWGGVSYQGKTVAQWLSDIGVGGKASSIYAAMEEAGRTARHIGYTAYTASQTGDPRGNFKKLLDSYWGVSVPGLAVGGKILAEGLAYLHSGEHVIPAATTAPLPSAVGGEFTLKNYVVLDGRVVATSVNKINALGESRKTGSSIGRRYSYVSA